MTPGVRTGNPSEVRHRLGTALPGAVVALLLAAGLQSEVPASGQGQASGTPSAIAPLAAPDSQSVAFAQVTQSQTEIAVASAVRGGHRAVARFAAKAEPVQWFPDGKSLLVVEHGRPPGVWCVPLAGQPKRIADGDNPAISSGGQVLGYMADGRVQLMQLATGRTVGNGSHSIPTSA